MNPASLSDLYALDMKRKPEINILFQIFEMMDAKARQDCIKEIDLLKVIRPLQNKIRSMKK